MNNSFREFMRRSAGSWNSQRRYIYTNQSPPKIVNYESDLSVSFVKEDEETFQVDLSWVTSDRDGKGISSGTMITIGDEFVLQRNVGYMSDEPTSCGVEMIDNDCVVLTTEYSGMRFREEIRLLNGDAIRLRQTLGWKQGQTDPFLCGQYFEERRPVDIDP